MHVVGGHLQALLNRHEGEALRAEVKVTNRAAEGDPAATGYYVPCHEARPPRVCTAVDGGIVTITTSASPSAVASR